MIPNIKQMYFKLDVKEGMSQRNLMKKYNLSRAEVRYYINKLAPKEKKDLKQVIKEMRDEFQKSK